MDEFNFTVPQGWQCPICKRVYAPSYPWCNFCGNGKTTVTTNTTVSSNMSDLYIDKNIKPDPPVWFDEIIKASEEK